MTDWCRKLLAEARGEPDPCPGFDWPASRFGKGDVSPEGRALLDEALRPKPEPESCAAQVAALYADRATRE
jgi:hypothetical protein